MIEALWRSLKHGWLYLHQLDTFAALEKLIAFYVEQHNTVVPHSAFAGQTPDEVYFGHGDQVPADLAAGRERAREARMKSNLALSCEACRPTIQETPIASDFSAISSVLQMRDEMSAMS
jgi:putative transposase